MQLGMLLWSYFSVVFTDPGSVPPNYRPLIDQERGDIDPLDASELGPLTSSDPTNTRIRYCRKCNQLKPPRCHHCSVCEFILVLLWVSIISRVGFDYEVCNMLLLYFRWEVCTENGSSLCVGC